MSIDVSAPTANAIRTGIAGGRLEVVERVVGRVFVPMCCVAVASCKWIMVRKIVGSMCVHMGRVVVSVRIMGVVAL